MKKFSPVKKSAYEVFEPNPNYHETQASFTQSECIVPDNRSQCTETSVERDGKVNSIPSRMNSLKSLSLKRRKRSKETKENSGYFAADVTPAYKYDIHQRSQNCTLPSPISPGSNTWFAQGGKRSYEIDEHDDQPTYEEIDGPSAERIPWYNTRGELFTSTQDPLFKDPQEPTDDYMDMEPTYNEPSPFMQLAVPRNDRIVNTKPVKPVIIPPMRKTISHSTVHSHKCTILAMEYQDMVPEPPKRFESLEDSAEKKKTPLHIKNRGKCTSGYDFVPEFHEKIKKKNMSFEKIVNEEVEPKTEPYNEGTNHDDVIPSFPTKPPNKPHNPLSHEILEKSKTLKPLTKPKIELRRSGSTSSVDENPTKNQKNRERTESTNKPPPPAVKPRIDKDLGNQFKQLKTTESIHSNSQFKELNVYQEPPSKGVVLKHRNSFEKSDNYVRI